MSALAVAAPAVALVAFTVATIIAARRGRRLLGQLLWVKTGRRDRQC